MFRHKIVRADGTTEVLGIKEGSFHFHEQVDTEGDIKVGNVIAGYLEFDFYLSANSTNISEGEELTYYQVKDFDQEFEESSTIRELQIGKYTVYSSEPNKTTCHIVAYDNIAKLSIDYSARLKTLANSFPMKIIDLLDDAATYAGVTSNVGHSSLVTLVSNADLSSFYSDSITVRDVFSYCGTILGINIKANSDGAIGASQYNIKQANTNWYQSDYYIICPTDQQTYIHPLHDQVNLIPVFYKQDGLMETDFTLVPFDCVKVYKSDGTLFGSYPTNSAENNPYLVSGNLLVDFISSGATSTLISRMCEYIYTNLRNAQIHTPLRVSLFPFRCPYRAGAITYFYDTNGSIVKIPIMSMDWSDSEVVVEVFGKETTNDSFSQYSTADNRSTVLSALINKALEGLDGKVSKSGDTMTGNLSIERPDGGSNLYLKDPTVTQGTASSATKILGALHFYTNNSVALGSLLNQYTTGGESQTILRARNVVNGSSVNNILQLGVDASGNKSVTISDADAWLVALGLTTQSTSTVSDILTSGTGITITSAQFATFGKVAQLRIVFSRSSAVASGNTTIATLASGKTPVFNALATCHTNHDLVAYVNANGSVVVNGAISANTSYTVYSTYILA